MSDTSYQEEGFEAVPFSNDIQPQSIVEPEAPADAFKKVVVDPKWRYAIIAIYSTKNNLRVVVTDKTTSVELGKISGGNLTTADRLKGSPKVAELMYQKLAQRLTSFAITHVEIRLRSVGSLSPRNPTLSSRVLIQLIVRSFNVVKNFRNSPESHGFMRPKSIRRVR